MIKKRIDDLREDDIMNHTLNIMLKDVDEKNWLKKAKDFKLQISHSVYIRMLIAKGWVIGQSTDDVYEIYEYILKGRKHLSKIQLTKTLTKYYGFKLVSKRMNGEIKRIYTINCSRDYFTLLNFFNEINEDEIDNMMTNQVYDEYKDYCIRIGLLPINKGEFSKQVKKYFDFVIIDKKIQGKKCRIFIKSSR